MFNLLVDFWPCLIWAVLWVDYLNPDGPAPWWGYVLGYVLELLLVGIVYPFDRWGYEYLWGSFGYWLVCVSDAAWPYVRAWVAGSFWFLERRQSNG